MLNLCQKVDTIKCSSVSVVQQIMSYQMDCFATFAKSALRIRIFEGIVRSGKKIRQITRMICPETILKDLRCAFFPYFSLHLRNILVFSEGKIHKRNFTWKFDRISILWYNSNIVRKTQNEHLNIVCQNLNYL